MIRSLCVSLAVICFVGCKSGPTVNPGPTFAVFPAAPGERVQLGFSPPIGKTLTEHSVTDRRDTPYVNGKAGSEVAATVELTLASSWTADGSSFALSQTVKSLKATQGGKAVDDPLAQLITHFPVKVGIASDGTFLKLLNPDDARKAVSESFTNPDEAAEVMTFFTPDAIEDQARIEWEQKYGDLFGKPLDPAKPSYTVDGTAIGETPVLYVIERSYVGTAKTPYGEAVVLDLKCVQKPEEAKDRAAYEELIAARGKPALEPTASCEGRQVIARSPFVPVSLRLVVKSKPKDAAGAIVGESVLTRATEAEALK
ncbi:MAG: hypothetical protein ACJ790_14495 [Myxococcaceae bacterium]